MRSAIFLDRDGTLIPDLDFPKDPDLVELMPRAGEVLELLRDKGYVFVIISNQSGIGRGILEWKDVMAVHDRVTELLGDHGVRLAGSYYCPHHPSEGCDCRKPSPSMILTAASDLDIDLQSSYMIGDKEIDIQAGSRAGCRTILLDVTGTTAAMSEPDDRAAHWTEIGEILMKVTR